MLVTSTTQTMQFLSCKGYIETQGHAQIRLNGDGNYCNNGDLDSSVSW